MPIRINLLAEQQAAEEARRRDPVKRSIWAGSGLVALMIFWAIMLQLKLGAQRSELADYQSKLQTIENNSKEARLNYRKRDELQSVMTSLDRYTSNRLFWASALDALQRVKVDNVRVTALKTSQIYLTNAETKFRTNMIMKFEQPGFWKFWNRKPQYPDAIKLVTNQIFQITNRVQYQTNAVAPITKYQLTTNKASISANIEIIVPANSTEQVVLTINGRNYGNPPGRQVEAFYNAIADIPYFKQRLRKAEGEGIRLKERSIKPELDPIDPVNPNMPFIGFTIECRYEDRIFTND